MDAKLNFLQVIRGLKCNHCHECLVRTGEGFPLDLKRGTELKLSVCCSGLLFLSSDPYKPECLLAIDLARIEQCDSSAHWLFLTITMVKQLVSFYLETDAGEQVCQSLFKHKKKLQRAGSTSFSGTVLSFQSEEYRAEPSPSQIALKTKQEIVAEGLFLGQRALESYV